MARDATAIAGVREQLLRNGAILSYDAPPQTVARR
jgi:hypothetical protein